MFQTVRGKTSLEIAKQNTGGFPDDIVEKVAQLPGVQAAVPLVQKPSKLTKGEGETARQVSLQVLGIDPEKDKAIRNMELIEGRLTPDDGDVILLEAEFVRYLDFRSAKKLRADEHRSLSGPKRMKVVGLIK
jgi:hypothetical protein